MMHVSHLRRAWHACLTLLTGLLAVGLPDPAQAQQDMRDPTIPPPMATAAPDSPASRSPMGLEGVSVIVRDGKPGLVVGTRVVLPGQKLGSWVLVRITETEIWLRDGKQLRKVARFSGIVRRDPAQVAACAAPATHVTPTKPRSGKNALVAATPKKPLAPTQADTPCDVPPTRSANP